MYKIEIVESGLYSYFATDGREDTRLWFVRVDTYGIDTGWLVNSLSGTRLFKHTHFKTHCYRYG